MLQRQLLIVFTVLVSFQFTDSTAHDTHYDEAIDESLNNLDSGAADYAIQLEQLNDLIEHRRTLVASGVVSQANAKKVIEAGQWEGELERTVIDQIDNDGNWIGSKKVYFLHRKGKSHQIAFLKHAPDQLVVARRIRVGGIKNATKIAAESIEVIDYDTTLMSKNGAWFAGADNATGTPPSCQTTGEQRGLTILVNYQDYPQENVTPATVNERYYGDTDSLAAYWKEASYNKTTLSGDTLGWYTIDVNSADLDRKNWCSYNTIRKKAIERAALDVDLDQYNRIFVVMLNVPQGCGFAGLSSGCSYRLTDKQGNERRVSAHLNISGYFRSVKGAVGLSAHEGGHDLGLPHATTEEFGELALGPIGETGPAKEYGDMFDTMGGNWGLVPGHYNAMYKSRLGWFSSSNVKNAKDGLYTIEPTTIASKKTKAIRIYRGLSVKQNFFAGQYLEKEYLWVESRNNAGFDTFLDPGGHNGALIHLERQQNYGNGWFSSKSILVDTKPGSADNARNADFLDAPLYLGESFHDPFSGIHLSNEKVDSNGSVSVRLSVDADKLDSDEDGISNIDEAQFNTDPFNPDSDNDGLVELLEICYDGDCTSYLPYPEGGDLNVNNADTDGDGQPDQWEIRNKLNPILADAQEDADADGLENLAEYRNGTNPKRADTDADGLGDYEEIYAYRTDPTDNDSDRDSMPDGWEVEQGLNPRRSRDAALDPDKDGLVNAQEFTANTNPHEYDTDFDALSDYDEIFIYRTNPLSSDSDRDGVHDGDEINAGTDPLDFKDQDKDGMSDDFENIYGTNPTLDDALTDLDLDGIINILEFYRHTSPSDANEVPVLRTWHVDASNLSGIEDGSAEFPYVKLGSVLTLAQAGDTVLLAEGAYNETFFPLPPLNFIGSGSANTTITSAISYSYRLYWMQMSNLTFRSSYGINLQNARNVFIDHASLDTSGVNLSGISKVTLQNCTFHRTSARAAFIMQGDAQLSLQQMTLSGFSTGVELQSTTNKLTVHNSIIATEASFSGLSDSSNIHYNLITDGQLAGLQGNLTGQALFVDEANGDLHLTANSLAIDTGDPSSAYLNEPHNNGGRVNMGAYGNTTQASVGNDADIDGLTDQFERCYDGSCAAYDPYDPLENPNGTDLNQLLNDTDADGVDDLAELTAGTNPLDPTE